MLRCSASVIVAHSSWSKSEAFASPYSDSDRELGDRGVSDLSKRNEDSNTVRDMVLTPVLFQHRKGENCTCQPN